MKNRFYLLGIVFLIIGLTGCSNNKSLQEFIIKQQERPEIISFDLSTSLLGASDQLTDEEDLEVLKSIKKLNIIAYQIKDSTNNTYKGDIEQLKEIFKSEKYQELAGYGSGKQGGKVYLVGTEDSIDEIIVFAKGRELGWFIARVLGDNMQADKIMSVLQKIDLNNLDIDTDQLKGLLKKTNG